MCVCVRAWAQYTNLQIEEYQIAKWYIILSGRWNLTIQ